jgi:hypothetical protein
MGRRAFSIAGSAKASGERVPFARAEEVGRLYRERYQGLTVKRFHERLVKDHGFGLMITSG